MSVVCDAVDALAGLVGAAGREENYDRIGRATSSPEVKRHNDSAAVELHRECRLNENMCM